MIAMLGLAIFAFQQRYSAVKAKAEEQQQRVIAEAASMEVARKNQSLQSLLFNVEKTLEQNKTIINLLSKMPDSKDRTSAMNELKELARTGKIPPESMPAVERLLKSYAEPVVIVARPRAYIQIQDKIQMEMANALRRRLEEMGYISGVELVKKGPDTTEVRFFYRIDESKAAEIVNILRDFGLSESRPAYVSGYEKSDLIKPGQYEIWLFNPAYERRMLQKAY